MSHKSFLTFFLLPALAFADGEAPAKAGGRPAVSSRLNPALSPPQPEGASEGTVRTARSGGIAIDFSLRHLLNSNRTPEGELNSILAATATLKADRPIRYRSTVLPPGRYPVSVVAGEERASGRSLFFLIGPVDRAERADGEGRGKAAPVLSPPRPPEGASEGASEGTAETKDPAEWESRDDPQGRGKGTAAERSRSGNKSVSGQIKAIFHLTPAAKTSDAVQFVVRPTARGDRFVLSVHSGASQGKATLRFAD